MILKTVDMSKEANNLVWLNLWYSTAVIRGESAANAWQCSIRLEQKVAFPPHAPFTVFGQKSSVVDPDQDPYPIRIQENENNSENRKLVIFLLSKCWMFWGLKASPVAWIGRPLWRPRDELIAIFDQKKDNKNFPAALFFQFLVIKTPGPEPYLDPDSL